jgi:hypothetical protein
MENQRKLTFTDIIVSFKSPEDSLLTNQNYKSIIMRLNLLNVFKEMTSNCFVSDISYHAIYLSLTCYYFKLKLSEINRQIKECISARETFALMKQLNSIHLEIENCNRKFWSIFITELILQLIFMITFCSYGVLFFMSQISPVFRFIIMYFMCFYFIIFSIFILCPSFVSFEAHRSFGLFNQLYIRLSKKRSFKSNRRRLNVK